MRNFTTLLMELAIANQPAKERIYREAYPVIDQSLHVLLNPLGSSGQLTSVNMSEAMTAADFPYALGEFVDRAMWPAYENVEFDYNKLVWKDTTSNFMNVTRYQRQSGLDDLEMITEKARPKPGYLADAAKRQFRVYRWEKSFDFSIEAIIDDDLGYFNEMAALMGQSARRTQEKFVSRLYFNTTTLASLTALGALYAGTARLSTNALMVAWAAFTQRLDARGEHIKTSPAVLVIPSALELVAKQILSSDKVAENNTNAMNVLPKIDVVIDPYLTGTAPNLPWFLFARPNTNGIKTVTVARMTGRDRPVILQKQPNTVAFSGFNKVGSLVPGLGDFETGNVSLKVADIWGGWADATYAGVTDYRGIYYSSGTTG